MGIKQEITGIKNIFGQSIHLLLLRLRVLRLDVEEQAAGILKIFAMIMAAAVCCLVGLTALLFGLNTVLSAEAKIWTFFGIAGVALLLVLCLILQIPGIWRSGSEKVSQTFQDMQEDLAYLNDKAERGHKK
ncbi:phage holin family protein [Neisseria sp. 83E34]|uniref:phage holin family protein n=1 Tax=Neisseria sp. 83E34 TaxID=1692264 RepID=UPI0006CE6A80|nr:phage holin family protein [Neisseria sp. 83E34]KPN70917.1 hypothetical protein AKG09_09640 [Neisseria sp. 83E34]